MYIETDGWCFYIWNENKLDFDNKLIAKIKRD